MDWTEDRPRAAGFCGFNALTDISGNMIPGEPGVCVVVRSTDEAPEFSVSSPAGHPEGADPAVSHSVARTA